MYLFSLPGILPHQNSLWFPQVTFKSLFKCHLITVTFFPPTLPNILASENLNVNMSLDYIANAQGERLDA